MLKNMKKSTKSNLVTLSIVVGFYIFIQILGGVGLLTNSFSGQLVPICAYVILAVSLNLTVGILGELSLGHAGFMSVGAFSGTLVYVVLHETAPQPLAMLLAFVVGGVVAGLFGFLVGIPVLRLSGDYLAIVTLAFGEIVKNVMNACYLGLDSRGLHFSLKDSASLNLEADGKVLINGAMGITGIKKASTFTIGIVLVIITLLVILNLVNSRAGRAITAIRDNEIAARSVGIPITKYKLMAFVTSAVFAGVAGVLYALNYSSLVAKKFDYNTSILILVFVVLGGIGNLWGALLGGIILGIVAIVLAVKAVKEAGKDGKATGGKVCGIIGIVLSVLSFILYLVIGFGAMAYLAANPGSVTVVDNAPYADSSSGLNATEDEKQAEAVAQAELDKLKNQDPAFVQQLAAQLDAEFADSAGYSLAELGVDPVAFVQWLLADFDYQLDGTYTSSDGTGTTYADVTMRDVYAFASTFMTDATAFSRSTEAGSMDEAAMKAKLGELFNAAMEKTTDTTESYIGVDLVKQGDAWVIDEESWADETELLFGNL